jgi:hypothetical protein
MKKRAKRGLALTFLATGVGATKANAAAELRGSRESMTHQHGVAAELDYTFIATPRQVRQYVKDGRLEPVPGGGDYRLSGVSFPYARPEIRLFVERLAARYHAETGTPLVVTSLTRPSTLQPSNASDLSVHPAGMAVDLRIPPTAKHRAWLERTLLALEEAGVLDVTRENNPPHFHVAVFPDAYREHVARLDAAAALARADSARAVPVEVEVAAAAPATVAEAPAVRPPAVRGSTVLALLGVLAPLSLIAAAVLASVTRRQDLDEDDVVGPRLPA